jgi:hypothetical protein
MLVNAAQMAIIFFCVHATLMTIDDCDDGQLMIDYGSGNEEDGQIRRLNCTSRLLNCNWAQAFDDLEMLIRDTAMQHELMTMASHWEGKFTAHVLAMHQELGVTIRGFFINDETGTNVKNNFASHMAQINRFKCYISCSALLHSSTIYKS